MRKTRILKDDGRYLIYCDFREEHEVLRRSGAFGVERGPAENGPSGVERLAVEGAELRWNPILEEWVVIAAHRQERTYKPPDDYCPLCPTRDARFPTEVPASDYEIVVFENKFPSLRLQAPVPATNPRSPYRVAAARGVCEVVLYTPEHNTTLAQQSEEHIAHLVEVWTDRYGELGNLNYVDYVLVFENKGDAIGVTLHHPHGQIYAFPFVPPRPARELDSSARYTEKNGRCIFCDVIGEELRDGRRLVTENGRFVAFVPFFARYPYEVHVFPREHRLSLLELSGEERRDLARILKTVLVKYDNLFGFSLPHMMVMHQAPTDGKRYEHYHFHVEFYPPHRTATKLKYLAGCESGAGSFINDTVPERKAEELLNASSQPRGPAERSAGGQGLAGGWSSIA